MENDSSEEEQFERTIYKSVHVLHNKKKDLTFEEDDNCNIKRCSSMSLNLPKNFVPKLKPIKTIICPSPINLNQPSIPEKINTKVSGISNERQEDLNLKPIKLKFIFSRKRNKKKSNKILNIEEETHETEAISDCEDKSKKVPIIYTDSDSSISIEEEGNKHNKFDILKNINFMREKMNLIRKHSICNDNTYDDSSIGNNSKNRLYPNRSIHQHNFINKLRKNKNMILNPSKMIKYRTKSFNIKQRYISTILGFLEKSNSTISLNSNGK